MSDFLQTILDSRRQDLVAAKAAQPLERLLPLADKARAGRRPFGAALRAKEPIGIVAEIKRASPSKGDLAPDLDPVTLAKAFQTGGAAALSVLTEPRYFKGSAADLAAARGAVRLPVLRKDFIFDDYQVIESAAMGADAILLIVRILPPADLARLHALALKWGMDALVEAAAPDEVKLACEVGARLIGINSRDLQTFKIDPDRAARLAPPPAPGRVVISLSGVAGRPDIDRQLKAGLTRFLVGESLVRAPNPASLLKSLKRAP
jgi:indole-3-glycerol phosphate synthase